jgi:hypothetical protein
VVSFDWKVQCVTLLPSFKSDVTLHQNFWWPMWFVRSLPVLWNFKAVIVWKAMDVRKKCWAHKVIVYM